MERYINRGTIEKARVDDRFASSCEQAINMKHIEEILFTHYLLQCSLQLRRARRMFYAQHTKYFTADSELDL